MESTEKRRRATTEARRGGSLVFYTNASSLMYVKPKVYLETSVISYYSGRNSRDVVSLGRQQITRLRR